MEQVITMYNVSDSQIVGLIIYNEKELGYIDDKIVVYGSDELKQPIFYLLSTLGKKVINTRDLNKIAREVALRSKLMRNIHFLESFELKSDNKNKSSRYKRILEHMNLQHLERSDFQLGT